MRCELARREIRRGYLPRSSRRINADIRYLVIGGRQTRAIVWLTQVSIIQSFNAARKRYEIVNVLKNFDARANQLF